MPIVIHSGDIFEAKVEALVIPANMQPDLGWGSHIAERVKKLAAPQVIKERKKYGKLALGEVCITSGVGTSFKFLLHAAVLNKYDFNPLFLLRLRQRTSDSTLKSVVANVAQLLNEHSISSIAISAMGAGIGGMDYKKCVQIIFSELWHHKCEIHFAAYKKWQIKIAQKEIYNFKEVEKNNSK